MNCTCKTNTDLHNIYCLQAATAQPNAMINLHGEVFYPDSSDDAAWFEEEHGAWYINQHPESYCHRCNGPNIDWSAASPLWNQVMRGGDINGGPEPFDGIICPTCFIVLAQEMGIAQFWRLSADRVHVPLQIVTPSGRTWNEKTFMWDDSVIKDED